LPKGGGARKGDMVFLVRDVDIGPSAALVGFGLAVYEAHKRCPKRKGLPR